MREKSITFSLQKITEMSNNFLNIVLVDDDEDDRMLFREALDELAMQTKLSLFKHGQELLDYLFQPQVELPNVIFLDLNMPVKNGIECLCEIRNNPKLKDVYVAIYSTSSSDSDIKNTFLNGASLYINKPNCFNNLKKTIENVLNLNWKKHTSHLNRDTFLFRIE